MGVVDTAVVGRAGPVPLAGAGLGNAIFFTVAVLGTGLVLGLDPLMAQAVGAGDRRRARALLWQGAWLALLASAALALPLALVPAALSLPALGIEPEVAREAGRYVLWRLPGLPFMLLYMAQRACLQAEGLGRPMVWATVLANAANVPLDLWLVFGGSGLPAWAGPLRLVPPLGASGAAIATSAAMVLQAAVLGRAVRDAPGPGGPAPSRAPSARDLWLAARVGLPTGLHTAAEVGFFALSSVLAARLGAVPLAAHQAALSVATLTFTVALGVGNAGAVRVGLMVGARDRAGARRAGLTTFAAAGGWMALCGLAFLAFPGAIARLMTDDPAVVAAAEPLFRLGALFQVADGVQAAGAGVLRGAGETRFTFAANMVGYWLLGLPAVVLLVFVAGAGVAGLWWGFVVGLFSVAAALLARFLRVSARGIEPLEARGTG
jgi:MATE family multidrug resistance protein